MLRRSLIAVPICLALMLIPTASVLAQPAPQVIEELGGVSVVEADLQACADTGTLSLIYAIIDYIWGPKLKEGCRITSFYLPIGQGGYIELLYLYVAATISINEANGVNTYNAESLLNQAQLQYDLGNYKKAYDKLALAYCTATKVAGESCPR